jgi:hypothetical protein
VYFANAEARTERGLSAMIESKSGISSRLVDDIKCPESGSEGKRKGKREMQAEASNGIRVKSYSHASVRITRDAISTRE